MNANNINTSEAICFVNSRDYGIRKILFVIRCMLILSLISGFLKAQNIALHKSYILSTPPNYKYSAPSTDKTALTDGIYTTGNFWTKPTTVGWLSNPFTVTIDLGEILPVGTIIFNTCRSIKADISFPNNIFVFISKDNKDFMYIGDIADTPDNLTGDAQVKKFTLKGIDRNARFITITAVPKGKFIFCDEIEVLKGKANNANTKEMIPKDSLNITIESLKALEYNSEYLSQAIENLKSYSKGKMIRSNKNISDIQAQFSNNKVSKDDYQTFKNRVGKEHARNLRGKDNISFILEKINPWDNISELREPKLNNDELNYQLLVLQDGVQYGSFAITNTDSSTQQFSFKVANPNSSVSNFELFHVPYVASSNYNRTPDPLVRIKNAISLAPGISEMFLFKITGINTGSAKSIITIRTENDVMKVNIETQVRNLFLQKNANHLNANVWAYLNYPMLKDRQVEVVKNLELHHINTIVIPPGITPGMEITDYSTLTNYLSNFENVENILLFMNYASTISRNGYKNGQFMSSEWKSKFILWHKNVVKLIRGIGFSNANIYLYPYDEVGDKNINDFENLVNWVKNAVSGIKIYATFNNKAAINTILPLIDIAQIHSSYDGLKDLPPHHCEIWIYNTITPARSLSPYVYYRLMAWEAFINDYKGIGFWNYADERNGNKLNLVSDLLPNFHGSYSVIYNGPGKEIISSRRWEAFQLGIEDYSILKLYEKKVGSDKSKMLAKKVLDDPKNLNNADSIRNEIITELSRHLTD